MVSRFWKNKLFKFFKLNKLKFPEYTIIAKVDCVIEIENETIEYTIPIEISKKIKDETLEILYCQIYNELTTSFYKSKDINKGKNKCKDKFKCNDKHIDKILDFEELSENNIGHKILEKLGWVKGEGLGVENNGIKTPIPITIKNNKHGLG